MTDRWLAAFLLLAATQRFWLEGREHLRARRGTIQAAWTGHAMVACHVVTYGGTLIELLQRPSNALPIGWLSATGLVLFLVGFLVRRWAIDTLGWHWSLQIEMRPDQSLVQKGPYRFIRHPNYLGLLLEVLAVPLIGRAYRTLAFVLVCYWPLIFVRLHLEEQVLLATFPEAYRRYQRACGAFVPRIRMTTGCRS
jgi:methyltransferase